MARTTLLPPAPDACQTCAVRHAPEAPHDPGSLYWQTARRMAGESPPTWELALAGCSTEVRDAWVRVLAEEGVVVDVREVERLREARR